MKRYINVAYKDRDVAKRMGARWDPSVKRWYCPEGSVLAKAYSWRKVPKGRRVATADLQPSIAANSNLRDPQESLQLSFLG